jgi:hypothetical protein
MEIWIKLARLSTVELFTVHFIERDDVTVTVQTCNREVRGSTVVWIIVYSDWGFSWFSLVPPGKFRDTTSVTPRALPCKSFPSQHSSIIVSFDAN